MGYEALTLAQLEEDLAAARAALAKARVGQSYQVGSRGLSRASASELRQEIKELSAEIARRSDETGGFGLVEFGEPR